MNVTRFPKPHAPAGGQPGGFTVGQAMSNIASQFGVGGLEAVGTFLACLHHDSAVEWGDTADPISVTTVGIEAWRQLERLTGGRKA